MQNEPIPLVDVGAGVVAGVLSVEASLLDDGVDAPPVPDPESVALALPTHAFQFSMLLVQLSVIDAPFICMMSLPFLEILTETAPRPLNGTLP